MIHKAPQSWRRLVWVIGVPTFGFFIGFAVFDSDPMGLGRHKDPMVVLYDHIRNGFIGFGAGLALLLLIDWWSKKKKKSSTVK